MIQKIEKIKNIGNYEDYTASGDVALKKMNLIYGENGVGKTTLARILHSLSVNDSSVILQHKRINSTTQTEVCIKDENGQFIFNGTKWNRNIPNIAVFDAHFVSENVYTGFQINSNHRKHLYKFVLGNTGVSIAEKIERVKKIIEVKKAEIAEISNQILIHTKGLEVEKVYKITPISNIDKLIEEKTKELVIAQNNNIILNYKQLNILSDISDRLDFDGLKRIFLLTIEGIGKEYLGIVQKHINELKDNNLEDASKWIYDGLVYLINSDKNTCPFCGRNTTGIQLIEGYNQYFSKRYKRAVEEAQKQKDQLEKINIELYINQFQSAYQQLEETYKFWNNYIENSLDFPKFDYNMEELKSCFNNLKLFVNNKVVNPVESINTNIIDDYKSKRADLTSKIELINKFIVSCNVRIAKLKNQIRTVEEVERELDELKINKKRFQQPVKSLCVLYKILKQHYNKLQKINKELQQQQKNTSNNIFRQYGQKTNYYLKDVFGTKFLISEIKDGGIKGRSKESDLDYILTFNGTPIEHEGESNTSFKNVLSEGDKNTIAFSFFLAKLTTESDLSNKIVVFDDPLTSLDLNRRNATIHQLVFLYQNCGQNIVLSHNLHFLIELNSRTLIKTRDKKSLQIINANGKSYIQENQIKKEWIDNYQKALNSMNKFINNPLDTTQEDAINAIRISLETFIKLKFCCYIPDPDQTFGTIISNLQNSQCVFINPDKTEVIDKLNQLLAISWRGHHGSIEEREEYSDVNLTNEEAKHYINMTLELLNREL